MEEHESNLRDLYAGFAMLAMIMRGAPSADEDVPARAWDMADHMISKDRKSTRLNSSHIPLSRMPSSA